jgi:hypothetical protein
MYTLANLFQFKRYLGISPTNSAEDDRLLAALETASTQLERDTGRRFSPYYATHSYDIHTLFPNELILHDDLLRLDSIRDGSGAIALDEVILSPAYSAYSHLKLADDRAFQWGSSLHDAIQVTGLWGWHNTPYAMWQSTGATNLNPVNPQTGVLLVDDTLAPYADGVSPRFSVGMVLRLVNEMMLVTKVNTQAHQVFVQRGFGGSVIGDDYDEETYPIERYLPPLEVVNIVLRLAAAHYRDPDGRATANGLPTPKIPAGLRRERVR